MANWSVMRAISADGYRHTAVVMDALVATVSPLLVKKVTPQV